MWNDLIDATTMKAYLIGKHSDKELYNTLIEIMRDRFGKKLK